MPNTSQLPAGCSLREFPSTVQLLNPSREILAEIPKPYDPTPYGELVAALLTEAGLPLIP